MASDAVGDGLDIRVRPAVDGAPRRRPEHRQHAVVIEEGEEVARRVAARGCCVARPHRGDERQHEVFAEVRGEVLAVEEVVERLVGVGGVEKCARRPVESGHLAEHAKVAASRGVARGGEQPGEAEGARILEAGHRRADRHRHVGVLGCHAQLGEEAQQRRVGAVVVDDETGIDADDTSVGHGHRVRVGVAAQSVVGFE